MKILSTLLVFLFLLVGVACDSSSPEDEVIGEWLSQSLRISDCDNPSDNASFDPMSSISCSESSPNGCIYQLFSFTASTYTSTSNAVNNGNLINLDATGTYTLDGNSAEFCETGQDYCRMGNLTVTGNTMTVDNLGDRGSNCLTSLTASRVE